LNIPAVSDPSDLSEWTLGGFEEGRKLMPDGYDVIGDIHGYAEELKALLKKLGYEERGGAFRHSARAAVFIRGYPCI
jgi:hypothetical protein